MVLLYHRRIESIQTGTQIKPCNGSWVLEGNREGPDDPNKSSFGACSDSDEKKHLFSIEGELRRVFGLIGSCMSIELLNLSLNLDSRKAEEKSQGCNGDEVEQHGLSPTPTKSSPFDPQLDTDAFEEFGIPIMAEPLNQVYPRFEIYGKFQSLLGKEYPPSGITRWLADKDDRSSKKPPDDLCNDHVAVEQEAEGGAVGDLGLHDPGWFSRDTSSALYENAILLPYDNNGPNVYSVDPGAESLQELFNSMKESNGHMSAFNNEVGLRENTGISGISSTHMTAQYNLSTEQGLARIRIRLQVGAISSTQIDSGTKKEENGGQTNVKIEDIKECDLRIKLNDLPIHDNIVASLNVEELRPSKNELKLRTRSKGITKFDKVRGPVLVLETSKSDVAMGCYLVDLINDNPCIALCWDLEMEEVSGFVDFGNS